MSWILPETTVNGHRLCEQQQPQVHPLAAQPMEKLNLEEKFSLFTDLWSPKVIAEMNDYQFKLAKVDGSFVWHDHSGTDEVFIVINGTLHIEFEDRTLSLDQGEMVVVPKGTRHRPFAEEECQIMLVEPRGVLNTGDGGHDKMESDDGRRAERTAGNDVWI